MRRTALWSFSCLMAVAPVADAQGVRACGVERWPVKIALDADIARVDTIPERTSVARLAALPRPDDTPQRARAGPYELKTYVVSVRIVDMFREEDSDWHLVIADTAAPYATIIAEVPDSQCALGSRYAGRFARLARSVDSLRLPAIADVTGIGFFDESHGQRGVAPNAFELHPIVGLRVVSSAVAALQIPRRFAPRADRRTGPPADGADTVWLNTRSNVYHCPGSRWYGRTRHGAFMTEGDALRRGAHAAYGRTCGRYEPL